MLLSQPWILLPGRLRLYPVPACFYLSVYLNLMFKEALVFPFQDFHLPVLLSKLAPCRMSLLFQGAFVLSSVCSLPQNPQAEVRWPDFFPAPVKPVPGASTCTFCAAETGIAHASEELAFDSAVLSSGVLGEPCPARGIWLQEQIYFLDNVNEQEQQRLLVE